MNDLWIYGSILLLQERHAAKTVGDMKQFVTKLPHLQQARTSLATCVYIWQYLIVTGKTCCQDSRRYETVCY